MVIDISYSYYYLKNLIICISNYFSNKITISEDKLNYYILQLQEELVRRNMKQVYKTKIAGHPNIVNFHKIVKSSRRNPRERGNPCRSYFRFK